MKLWIIAGPNGAGKSSIGATDAIRSLLGDIQIINPDRFTYDRLTAAGYSSYADVPVETEEE